MKARLNPVPPKKPEGIAAAMQMGAELLAGAFVGGISGFYMDSWLGTSPFLFILSFFLGCAGGFLTLMREMDKKEINEMNETKDTAL